MPAHPLLYTAEKTVFAYLISAKLLRGEFAIPLRLSRTVRQISAPESVVTAPLHCIIEIMFTKFCGLRAVKFS